MQPVKLNRRLLHGVERCPGIKKERGQWIPGPGEVIT